MRKELAAAALLLLICCASLWHLRHLTLLLDDLRTRAEATMTAAEAEQWETASAAAEGLRQKWQQAEAYTQIFIRHPDIDAVSDALTALRSAVLSRDMDACRTAASSILERLRAIRQAEMPSPGSIL